MIEQKCKLVKRFGRICKCKVQHLGYTEVWKNNKRQKDPKRRLPYYFGRWQYLYFVDDFEFSMVHERFPMFKQDYWDVRQINGPLIEENNQRFPTKEEAEQFILNNLKWHKRVKARIVSAFTLGRKTRREGWPKEKKK